MYSSWIQEERAHLREITRLGCVVCRLLGRGFVAIHVYYIKRQTSNAGSPGLGVFGLCGPHHDAYLGAGSEGASLEASEDEFIALARTLLEFHQTEPADEGATAPLPGEKVADPRAES